MLLLPEIQKSKGGLLDVRLGLHSLILYLSSLAYEMSVLF